MLLWVLRQGKPIAGPTDRLYPPFIWESLPTGIAGLAMAAIIAAAMANLSAALNSLASATVVDFYRAAYRRAPHSGTLPAGFAPFDGILGGRARVHRAGGEPVGFGARIGALDRLSDAGYSARVSFCWAC